MTTRSSDGSGRKRSRWIYNGLPAAGGGRKRRWTGCRARGLGSFGVDDELDKAEMMACSGRHEVAGDEGELELEFGSNGGREERWEETEWGEGNASNGLQRRLSTSPT